MIFIQNKTFKTIHVSFFFIESLKADTLPYRFLLAPHLMMYTDQKKTLQSFVQTLFDLYGIDATHRIFYLGNHSVMQFNFIFPHPKYIKDASYLKQVFSFIRSIFFNRKPFSIDLFAETKQNALDYIESLTDHKYKMGRAHFLALHYKNYLHKLPSFGTLEGIQKITHESLYAYYTLHFLTNTIQMYVSGHITSSIKKMIHAYFKPLLKNDRQFQIQIPHFQIESTHQTTTIDLKQAFIYLGYHLNIQRNHPLYLPAQLITLMLGGYPESILFKTIREDLGLAYDIYMTYHPEMSLLYCFAGMNLEHHERGFVIMKEKIQNFLFEGPTLKALKDAQRFLISELYTNLDTPFGYIERNFYQHNYGLDDTIDELVLKIERVTLEDIFMVLKKIEFKTSYILKGKRDEG